LGKVHPALLIIVATGSLAEPQLINGGGKPLILCNLAAVEHHKFVQYSGFEFLIVNFVTTGLL
jgi:hypothetical protein